MNSNLNGGLHYINNNVASIKTESPSSTEEIISAYEQKLNSSIAFKTLKSAKEGTVLIFTPEENAYLTKKSEMANNATELQVITPSPDITLKKGSTEISIKNAADLFQRMEEKCRPTTTIVNEKKAEEKVYEHTLDVAEYESPSKHSLYTESPIKTVNKNAYEIRECVLDKAIGIVEFSLQDKCDTDTMVNKVLDVASKLYEFIENKKLKKT